MISSLKCIIEVRPLIASTHPPSTNLPSLTVSSIRFLISSLLILLCFAAKAAPRFSIENYQIYASVQRYVENAAAYDGKDSREIISQYAKSHAIDPDELAAKVSGTGMLKCGRFAGSANLTLSSTTITTAAHILCKGGVPADECTFTFNFIGQKNTIRVDKLVAQGDYCPITSDKYKDWAILRLKSSAKGPIPYKIDPQKAGTLPRGSRIVAVEDISIDFCARDKRGKCIKDPEIGGNWNLLPKTIQDCTSGKLGKSHGEALQLLSNCAASEGASGGAGLDGDLMHPTLLGIFEGTKESPEEIKQEVKSGKAVVNKYSEDPVSGRYTCFVPVTGEFADAVRSASE